MKKIFYLKDSLYPHEEKEGESSGVYDISINPLSEKYRSLIPKSEKLIHIGQTEELPHGTLKCFIKKININKIRNPLTKTEIPASIKKEVVVVGIYKDGKVVGKELLYEATLEEIKNGIPEWKFDTEHISMLANAWDYQSTDLWIWTISGLRKDGKPEITKNLS